MDLQLGHDVIAVTLDGFGTDRELLRDLSTGAARGDQGDDLRLTRRESAIFGLPAGGISAKTVALAAARTQPQPEPLDRQ